LTLYVSDLDGTLLDPQARLSDTTKTGLIQLLDAGLQFSVASARHVVSIREIFRDVPLKLPVISSNGAYLSDAVTGHHELVNAMDPALSQAVFGRMRRHGFTPFVLTHGPKGDQLFYESVQNEGQRRFVEERQRGNDPRLRHTDRIADELVHPAITLLVIAESAPLQALYAEIDALCGNTIEMHLADDLYMPGYPWLNVHDAKASKAQAIHSLAERYGLHERELVVFGDHVNDLSMFRTAHRGIAVANALDELKALAHEVIAPHHEDAVLRFIQRDWQQNRPDHPSADPASR
jgi:Cof subfamily protein (haloacid dehalogenase superfamily)